MFQGQRAGLLPLWSLCLLSVQARPPRRPHSFPEKALPLPTKAPSLPDDKQAGCCAASRCSR